MEREREGAAETQIDELREPAGEVPAPAQPAEENPQWWRNDAPGPREVQ